MGGTPHEDLRICVTGLSGSGKTAFITALADAFQTAHHAPGNFMLWDAVQQDEYLGAECLPPGGAIGGADGFPFYESRRVLFGNPPAFPAATDRVRAGLLVAMKQSKPSVLSKTLGFFRKSTSGAPIRRVAVTIVDYPGEWALDLPMRRLSFVDWSRDMIQAANRGIRAEASKQFLTSLEAAKPGAAYDSTVARAAHQAFVEYLEACRRDHQLSYLQPGHFLRPERLGGRAQMLETEAVRFFPLIVQKGQEKAKPGSFLECLSTRFENYKANQIDQFFGSLKGPGETRQVVLFDLLSAIAAGPECYQDARRALAEIAAAMEPQAGLLGRLFGPTLRVLYAATKADYLHSSQRSAMQAHIETMVPGLRPAKARARNHLSLALASIRVTRDIHKSGEPAVAGSAWVRDPDDTDDPRAGRLVPGSTLRFPPPPPHVPTPADWLEWERAGVIGYRLPDFRPDPADLGRRRDLPHHGLDAAIEFLVGDHV